MSKPFTFAKAIAVDNGKIVMGSVDRERGTIRSGDNIIAIDTNTLCFNTGFTDSNGEEIFEGDYIRGRFDDFNELVFFDQERGAFYLSHIENLPQVEYNGEDEVRYCDYPNATVLRRLTAQRAAHSTIVNPSMLETIAAPVDPAPLVDTIPEIDSDAFDTIPVDPDAGDDISVDWGKRVDEATGEY